jgi:hypothetical protein
MSLETCDTFGFAGLTDGVDSVANSDTGLNWLQLLVQSDQHAWVDRQSQVEQEVVIFADNEGFHISGAKEDSE